MVHLCFPLLHRCVPFSFSATISTKNSQWAPTIAKRGREKKWKRGKEISHAQFQDNVILEKLHAHLFFYLKGMHLPVFLDAFCWEGGHVRWDALHCITLQYTAICCNTLLLGASSQVDRACAKWLDLSHALLATCHLWRKWTPWLWLWPRENRGALLSQLAMRSRYHTYLCTFLQGGEDLQEALSS